MRAVAPSLTIRVVEAEIPDLTRIGRANAQPLMHRLANGGTHLATEDEVRDVRDWLQEHGVGAKLQVGGRRSATATWEFPVHPLIPVSLDGVHIADVDYLEQSASVRWALTWLDQRRPPMALTPLATLVPDAIDRDLALRDYVMGTAIAAMIEAHPRLRR